MRKYVEATLDKGLNWFAGFFHQVLTQMTKRCPSGKQHWIMLRAPSNCKYLTHRPQEKKKNPRGTNSVDNKDREVSIICLPGRQRQNNVESTYNAIFLRIDF